MPVELLADLESEAKRAGVSLSEVIVGRLRDSQQAAAPRPSELDLRVEQLVLDLADLRAKVLPLVATITELLRQMEGELPKGTPEAGAEPTRIATYEEIYGQIMPASNEGQAPTGEASPRAAPATVKPKRFWPW